MKLYFVIPKISNNGGNKIFARIALKFKQFGYDAHIVVMEEPPKENPWDFDFEHITVRQMEDSSENKVISSWGPDLRAVFDMFPKNQLYFFAQDCCQNANAQWSALFMPLILNERTKLITNGEHTYYYWLYRFFKEGRIVTCSLDTNLYKPSERKYKRLVTLLDYRGYARKSTACALKEAGYHVAIAKGSPQEVAKLFSESEYFVSCQTGVFNGINNVEGWPGPPMEAMACGCVTFALNSHGVRSYLYDGVNGFYYETDDELIEMLNEVDKSDELKTLIVSNALRTTHVVFNEDRTFEEFARAIDVAPSNTWWDRNYNQATVDDFLNEPCEAENNKSRVYFRDWLKKQGEITLLDVGCGRAIELSGYLQDNMNSIHYTGIDFSKVMIDYCASHYNTWSFIHSNIDALDLELRYDVVLLRHVLEHQKDYRPLLQEAVKHSQKFVVICLYKDFVEQHQEVPYFDIYDNFLSESDLKEALRENGLSIIEMTKFEVIRESRRDILIICRKEE